MSEAGVAAQQGELLCVRCHQPVVVNKHLYYDVLERMHELCFHLEYEHDEDPDEPCRAPFCPQFKIQVFQRKLTELGYEPQALLDEAVRERYRSKD